MNIKQLELKNWRNYEYASLALSSGINVILGNNAQGKTNLLEAIYICGVGKGTKTTRDKELIRWDGTQAKVKALLSKKNGDNTLEIIINDKFKKVVAINGLPLVRIGDLMGECSCVLFSPDEMRIVKDAPSERRRFVDIALCQMSKIYFYILSDFTKILAQRNKLLKTGQTDDDSLDVWDMQLSIVGAKIIKNRRGFVKELESFARIRHSYLTDCKEILSIKYEGIGGDNLEEIKDKFLQNLQHNRALDIKHGYTSIGPHKDDLFITIDGVDVRAFGSQGQQRTTSLSLKLAEVDILTKNSLECPILLLDDVLSELDMSRCDKLLSVVKDMQTIITATHIEQELQHHLKDAKVFNIVGGKVI